jgi:hypothetical protein
MRRTVQSMALMLALLTPAYAGEMQFPRTSPTPPPPTATQGQETEGDIPTPSQDETTGGSILDVLTALLALL